ncbi:MAG: ABC transporter ATP-binding protein, partial [Thermodesulfobacteriota bacterium]
MLCLQDVSKNFKNGKKKSVRAVDRLNLTVHPEEFVCIVGRSGCGKTTTLRMIAGLETVSSGNIRLNGRTIRKPGPDRCVVFQKYTLFPWRTVLSNIAFGPEMKKMKKAERYVHATRFLDIVGLSGYADAYPGELSGGMQQRVAVARALAADPQILLMDEPFGALDARTRERLQKELLRIWDKERKTVLFITHSINEAVCLADRIVVMHGSRGTVSGIIENPLARPRDMTGKQAGELIREVSRLLEKDT